MNYYGVTKTTTYVENYLINNYNLQDHRGEEDYEHWEEACKRFENRLCGFDILKMNLVDGYNKEEWTGLAVLDCMDTSQTFSNNIPIHNMKTGSISGWIQIDSIENKRVYLRIGDYYYGLRWIERPDVVSFFGSTDYYGYSDSFTPYNLQRKVYDTYLVVVDNEKKSYMEYLLNAKCEVR